MLSAAPVGRLVLDVFQVSSAQRVEWSDKVCIALQVIEHLQDVGEDARRGRIYLPARGHGRVSIAEEDLLALVRHVPRCAALLAVESRRARELLSAGAPLASSLPLQPRFAISGFVGGGLAAIDSIERADYDVLSVQCRPRKRGVAEHLTRLLVAATFHRSAA